MDERKRGCKGLCFDLFRRLVLFVDRLRHSDIRFGQRTEFSVEGRLVGRDQRFASLLNVFKRPEAIQIDRRDPVEDRRQFLQKRGASLSQRRNVGINVDISASVAGVGRKPAFVLGRRGDDGMIVVTDCRQFAVGRVVATRARIVGVPADLGACSSYRIVVDQVVSERGEIARFGMVANTARPLLRTFSGTSGSFRLFPFAEYVRAQSDLVLFDHQMADSTLFVL